MSTYVNIITYYKLLPLFNRVDALYDESTTSMSDSSLVRGDSQGSLLFDLLHLPLNRHSYLDSILAHQTTPQERSIQINMLFVPIAPQTPEAATPPELEPLEIIMNWLANEVGSEGEIYSLHRSLLQTQGDFQGKETFKENFVQKGGKLRAKKLLNAWMTRLGRDLPNTLNSILKQRRYPFSPEVQSAFDKIVRPQDMVKGHETVINHPDSKRVQALFSKKK